MNGRIKRPEAQTRTILPRIGKIKIGKKAVSANGREYPTSVDYFIPTGKYAGLFAQAYGEKPSTIQIVFPSDNAEDVCCEKYEYRNDKGELIAHGDGEVFHVWNGREYQKFTTEEIPDLMERVANKTPNKAKRDGGDGWRVRLTLNFLVPLVQGIAGLWTFETNGSASTIPQCRDTFDTMLRERGFCKGVIFDLNVKFATSQHPDSKSKYPVVSLVPNESAENLQRLSAARENNFLQKNTLKTLPNEN